MPHLRALPLILIAALALTGCITRSVKRPAYVDQGIEVFLRSQKRFTSTQERHFSHPVTISPVRMAHILSRIDIRKGDDKERSPAIPTEVLYSLGEGIAKALAEATPDEEVIAQSIRKSKHLYLFDRNHLTNFLLYARGEQLFIHLSRTEWEIPPRRKEKLPEPRVGDHPMKFRIFPGTAMALVDRQSIVVDWRDPIFRNPTRTSISAGGEVVRRNILLESPREEWMESQPQVPADVLEGLSPDQLRGLADIEERRRRGELTEAEYRQQRRALLGP